MNISRTVVALLLSACAAETEATEGGQGTSLSKSIVAARHAFDFGCYAGGDPKSVMPWQLEYLSLWYSLGRRYACHDGVTNRRRFSRTG